MTRANLTPTMTLCTRRPIFKNIDPWCITYMLNPGGSAMSGSTNSSMHSSLHDEEHVKQIKDYEVLVVDELGRINDEYLNLWNGIPSRPQPRKLLIQVDFRKKLLEKLQSAYLPTLRQHITALSEALIGQFNVQQDPVLKLKLVLEVLPELDATLGKIKYSVAHINPGLNDYEVNNDKDFDKLKQFFCCRLALRIYPITGLVSACSHSIDTGIEYITNKSELNLIQDVWHQNMASIDEVLERFLEFGYQMTTQLHEERHSVGDEVALRPETQPEDRDEHDSFKTSQLEDQLISPAAESMIALMKLSRLFLAHLSKVLTDQEKFSMVSDLTSRELEHFRRATNMFTQIINDLLDTLLSDTDDNHDEDILKAKKLIHMLICVPKVILACVVHVFVPVVPKADQPSPKTYFKAWFYHWNTLFRLAARNLLEGIGITVI
ncbi:hypothetical protein, variant [Puccinia striiformis f. sp. tritici PST-78]|uniref:Uncharacterized protein n=1 Tax=Puccinia striiformis f. sp. tritici PST-78 TaxID=1165861 RepID=A0A0L0VQR0_9BASI|nr:hypothetical protein, variant [Puccinia striiformis f. sp. tritici PST-78]